MERKLAPRVRLPYGLSVLLMLWVLCLFCLALVFWGFAGYPLAMAILSRRASRPLQASEPDPAGVSVVMCVAEETEGLRRRLENLLDSEGVPEMEVVVYRDGWEAEQPCAFDERVRWIGSKHRRGKAAGLNLAIPQCRFPIVVLCDVRQRFDAAAIGKLVAAFRDPRVAAASGLLEIEASESGTGQGVDLYWRLERKLREWEAKFDSVIGCTGAICALRRDRFEPLPEDTILDDVVIPMRLAFQGARIFYEPEAVAYDPQQLEAGKEKRRKRRTLVGNYQMFARHPEWILPWRCRLWWQLISHKYLRLATPWLLVMVAVISPLLPDGIARSVLIWGQVVCYGLGLLGMIVPGLRGRCFSVPAGFLQLQWSALEAGVAYLRHRRNLRELWTPAGGSTS